MYQLHTVHYTEVMRGIGGSIGCWHNSLNENDHIIPNQWKDLAHENILDLELELFANSLETAATSVLRMADINSSCLPISRYLD